MKRNKAAFLLIVAIILLFMPPLGCGQNTMELAVIHNPSDETPAGPKDGITDIPPEMVPLSPLSQIPAMPMPAATGDNAVMNYIAEIDVSNAKDGYIMVRYLKKTHKALKVIVKGPSGTPYIYTLRADGEYEVFPLSAGNGIYQITVYENVIGNKYSTVLGTTQNVQLTDEFAPFIRPNQYVNYNRNSKVTEKAAELTKDSKNTIDKISVIYNYVIENITYDHQLAASVQSGYIPDVDKVLKNGKGICFDYASLMTAMLRSQGVPTKLVVGYRGKAYHAWISAYSKEKGWVDGVICFDGNGWKLMDPTFASNGGNSGDVSKYIGNENNYFAKYIY